jgi:hypothetical protein
MKTLVLCGIAAALPCACSGGAGTPQPLPLAGGAGLSASSTVVRARPAAQTPPPDAVVSGRVMDLSSYDPDVRAGGGPGWSVLANGTPARGVAPVRGAYVLVGPYPIDGATPPPVLPPGDEMAVTDAAGRFSLRVPLGQAGVVYPGEVYWLDVFPSSADQVHRAVIHRTLSLAAGNNVLPEATTLLAAVTRDEVAYLRGINADRARFGAPPLLLDETMLESARYWAHFMATTGYFAHCIPAASCTPGATATPPPVYGPQDVSPAARDAYFHDTFGSSGENIAAGYPSWSSAEAMMMAERAFCPGGSPVGCPQSERTAHFLNIVNGSFNWGGVAIATHGMGGNYYDTEFWSLQSIYRDRY